MGTSLFCTSPISQILEGTLAGRLGAVGPVRQVGVAAL